jgi:hypothetical protein
MLSAKQAVAAAAAYMREIYGSPEGLLVEEIELDGNLWIVTMGFWLELPQRNLLNGLSPLDARRVRRVYKELRLGADNGEVISMRIRELPELK